MAEGDVDRLRGSEGGPSGSDDPLAAAIAGNLHAVRERIARACDRARRDPSTVRLVGVSKTFPLAHVRAAVAAGLTDLGENRVQEAAAKIAQSAGLGPVAWHLIGHLQSNKARRAVVAAAWIHSVDSVQLLRRLERAAGEEGATADALVQVDLAGERTKSGAPPDEARRILEAAAECRAVAVRGLMALPPWSADPERARPWFRRLRELRDALAAGGVPRARLGDLSMGMSNDFEVAIEEGATVVRVGTAIFGRRTAAGPGPAGPG